MAILSSDILSFMFGSSGLMVGSSHSSISAFRISESFYYSYQLIDDLYSYPSLPSSFKSASEISCLTRLRLLLRSLDDTFDCFGFSVGADS